MDNILKGKASEGFNKVKGIFGWKKTIWKMKEML
jgi:hypothetical protein